MEIVSSGQTRVQSVSVIPTTRKYCNAHCKPCVACQTPGAKELKPTWVEIGRVNDLLDYGRQAGAVTAIITSKSEPTLDLKEDLEKFLEIVRTCRRKLPQVDMHTNGKIFLSDSDCLPLLSAAGLNMITFSVASFDPAKNKEVMGIDSQPERIIDMALSAGLLVRMSLLITKKTSYDVPSILDYISCAKKAGVDMVVCRELYFSNDPLYNADNPARQWALENNVPTQYVEERFFKIAHGDTQFGVLPIRYVRTLPWGARVYDVDGVNVTFAHCDEKCVNGTFKSIQLVPREKPNGRITWRIQGSWGSAGDVLG